MIVNKLEELFSELNQEEIEKLNNSDVDMACDLDKKIVSRIWDRVKMKAKMI